MNDDLDKMRELLDSLAAFTDNAGAVLIVKELHRLVSRVERSLGKTSDQQAG